MIEARTNEKKQALKAQYDAFIKEKDEQIAAIDAERQAAKAAFDKELARVENEAAAASAFAM